MPEYSLSAFCAWSVVDVVTQQFREVLSFLFFLIIFCFGSPASPSKASEIATAQSAFRARIAMETFANFAFILFSCFLLLCLNAATISTQNWPSVYPDGVIVIVRSSLMMEICYLLCNTHYNGNQLQSKEKALFIKDLKKPRDNLNVKLELQAKFVTFHTKLILYQLNAYRCCLNNSQNSINRRSMKAHTYPCKFMAT